MNLAVAGVSGPIDVSSSKKSYGYAAPRERYVERRGYEERGGIGFSAPGVSVGIGTGRY